MKRLVFLVGALFPLAANAFPIAVGAAGVGVLGLLALPIALLVGACIVATRKKMLRPIPLVLTGLAVLILLVLQHDYSISHANRANLFNRADTSFLSPSVPFPFTSQRDQAKSSQAVSPAEFLTGLREGHFKALRVSIYPSLFAEHGQLSVDAIWQDKNSLSSAVNRLGGRVVLVDEYGGIAATIADSALKQFGINVGFLEGGTTALSSYGWQQVRVADDPSQVPVENYRSWLREQDQIEILSLTTDREFVEDGWFFGGKTLTLADFVAGWDEFGPHYQGRRVFVAGFETNDIGATPVVVSLLRSVGAEVSYVMPAENELLVKEAYFDTYRNAEKVVGLDDAKRYIQHRPDVAFLDFGEIKASGYAYPEHRLFHLPMQEVAAGKLPEFVASLDPTKTYIGLAFDRRSAYHSLIAGQLLSERGVPWLGRITQPATLTEQFISNEDLTSLQERIAHETKSQAAKWGRSILGALPAWGSLAMGGLLALATAALWWSRLRVARIPLVVASVVVYGLIWMGANDYPAVEPALVWVNSGYAFLLACVAVLNGLPKKPRIRAFSSYTPELPPKAEYLNEAAVLGYRIAPGVVLAPRDDFTCLEMEGRLVVRSATWAEAEEHSSTAGMFNTYCADSPAATPGLINMLFDSYAVAGVAGRVLVQEYVEAALYGVVQFQEEESSPWITCSVGAREAVTGGAEPDRTYHVPAWNPSAAPKHVRKAVEALVELASIGAWSVEFALSSGGRLTILQVNKDNFRACAEKRLIECCGKEVVEVASAHRDPLSASIVAALSPGHIFAYGNRRFCEVLAPATAKHMLAGDLKLLGFRPAETSPEHLRAWLLERRAYLAKPVDQSGSIAQLIERVALALHEASTTVGRVNRIATLHLSHGRVEQGSQRYTLPTTQIGESIAQGRMASWEGTMVWALAGYDAYSDQPDFSADHLAVTRQTTTNGYAYVKDAATALLMMRLAALQPAIHQIVRSGGADLLMRRLNSQVGCWSARRRGMPLPVPVEHHFKFHSLFTEAAPRQNHWRVPAQGISGVVSTPSHPVSGGVLLLNDCSMEHLPLLGKSSAIVALRGSITSHLMQHAAAVGVPVVIGGNVDKTLRAGEQVRISPEGRVARA